MKLVISAVLATAMTLAASPLNPVERVLDKLTQATQANAAQANPFLAMVPQEERRPIILSHVAESHPHGTPEPNTWLVVAGGLLVVVGVARWRRA